MSTWVGYRKEALAEMRPFVDGEDLEAQGITVNEKDVEMYSSPKLGDFVVRNPQHHADTWLISMEEWERLYSPIAYNLETGMEIE